MKGRFKRHPISVYLVIDFEATCDEEARGGGADYPCEIIEFPCVALCANTHAVLGEFHTYVKPVITPILSPFCRNLTGVKQRDVATAPDIHSAVVAFSTWVDDTLSVADPRTLAVVSDGPCDIARFLQTHILRDSLRVPKYLRRWCNVRMCYKTIVGEAPRGTLRDMVEDLGMEFEGRAHSGLDDARNVARIVVALRGRGGEVLLNEALP